MYTGTAKITSSDSFELPIPNHLLPTIHYVPNSLLASSVHSGELNLAPPNAPTPRVEFTRLDFPTRKPPEYLFNVLIPERGYSGTHRMVKNIQDQSGQGGDDWHCDNPVCSNVRLAQLQGFIRNTQLLNNGSVSSPVPPLDLTALYHPAHQNSVAFDPSLPYPFHPQNALVGQQLTQVSPVIQSPGVSQTMDNFALLTHVMTSNAASTANDLTNLIHAHNNLPLDGFNVTFPNQVNQQLLSNPPSVQPTGLDLLTFSLPAQISMASNGTKSNVPDAYQNTNQSDSRQGTRRLSSRNTSPQTTQPETPATSSRPLSPQNTKDQESPTSDQEDPDVVSESESLSTSDDADEYQEGKGTRRRSRTSSRASQSRSESGATRQRKKRSTRTAEEAIMHKRKRNAEAARRSRARKQHLTETLEEQWTRLREAHERLQAEHGSLEAERQVWFQRKGDLLRRKAELERQLSQLESH